MRNGILLLGLVLGAALSVPTGAGAAEFFIPQGHSYSPDSQRLPPLNSRRDRIQARTDELESIIHRRNLEQRRLMEELNSFQDHVFGRPSRRSNNW